MAPEIQRDEKCNEKVDVYSFGVIAYYIINEGELPKYPLSELIRGQHLQIPPSFAPNAKEIVQFCHSIDPQARPSFKEIVDYLVNDQFNLMNLSKSELQKVHSYINEHQKRIKPY